MKKRQHIRSQLKRFAFKTITLVMVLVYVMLPFREELEELLHDASHRIEVIIDKLNRGDIQNLFSAPDHHHQSHGDGPAHHHAHHHNGAGSEEDHSHALLAFMAQWLDHAATDQEEKDDLIKWKFDTHYQTQTSMDQKQFFQIMDDPCFFSFSALSRGYPSISGQPPDYSGVA